jgi:hypothetical protein
MGDELARPGMEGGRDEGAEIGDGHGMRDEATRPGMGGRGDQARN